MRLITFEDPVARRRVGAIAPDERIVDLHAACALYLRDVENEGDFYRLADALVPPNMRQLFAGGDTSLEAAFKAFDHVLRDDGSPGPGGEPIFYASDEVALLTPILPGKFFHSAGFRNVDAIVGHDEPVIYPEHLTQELDCDLELGVVLKKSGKNILPEKAADYIGGYVIFNDITARDIQRREIKAGGFGFGFSKGIDTFTALGPWIVTADEIRDSHNLTMELRVNGEPRYGSHSSKLPAKIPELLARYSPMGYNAGDVISAGIAVGAGSTNTRFLKVGDVVECEIERIGVLRNPIISWDEAYGHKPTALAAHESSS